MRGARWKKSLLGLLSGSMLLQASGCVEPAIGILTAASVVTAGGVIYLITRVLD